MDLLQTMRHAIDHACQARHIIGGAELGCVLTDHAGGMHLDARGLWWFASPALVMSR